MTAQTLRQPPIPCTLAILTGRGRALTSKGASKDHHDTDLGNAIVALRGLLDRLDLSDDHLTPWRAPRSPRNVFDGRISATDQLSWWFRPANSSDDPWDAFFADADEPDVSWAPAAPTAAPAAVSTRIHPRVRPPRSDPPEEVPEADAESVVTCMYDFVHAVGRDDLDGAMSCVANDFHSIDHDREMDREDLYRRLKAIHDSLIGWEKTAFLVEIPHPVPYGSLVLMRVEIQVNARHKVTGERRTIADRRVAVFERQTDRCWLLAGLGQM